MRSGTGVVSVLGLMAFCSVAVAEATKLPASVTGDLTEIAGECTGVGGKALTNDAVKRADLNADGKEDYVLDVGSIQCEGAASAYGDRAKPVLVYVGDGSGGAKKAFDAATYGIRIETSGPTNTLWLTVSGQLCGQKTSPDFANERWCERPIAWTAATQKFDFAPLSKVKMLQ